VPSSESFTAKSPRAGNEYFYDARPAFLQILTLGLHVPGWAQARSLDRFRIRDQQLEFEDLAVKHGFAAPREHSVEWSCFENRTQQSSPLPGASGLTLPEPVLSAAPGEYFCAQIRGTEPGKTVTVYLRRGREQIEVVGLERAWPR